VMCVGNPFHRRNHHCSEMTGRRSAESKVAW
jgi:hypothetical protein